MKPYLSYLSFLLLLAAALFVTTTYREAYVGPRLYDTYFDRTQAKPGSFAPPGFPSDYYQHELAVATAAMSSGDYGTARRVLQEIPTEDAGADSAALWYLSLLDLRERNLPAAEGKLRLLAVSPYARTYPVGELLKRVERQRN